MSLNQPPRPGMDPAPNPNPNPNPTPTSTNSDDPKGSTQDRINQLTRRASDAERAASASITENSELQAQLGRLEQQIASLSARPAPAALGDNLDISGADKPANFDTLAKQITDNVLGAVKPVLDEVRQEKADSQLATAHQQSFLRAAQVHPELNDASSPLHKTFMQLWQGSPQYQQLDGSPELLAEAAKGLLSGARVDEQVRKMAAAADTPKGSRPIDQQDDGTEINEAITTLAKTGKDEGWNADEFEDFLTLKFRQFGRGQA